MRVGDVIDGKYLLVRLLGEGGMGSVYEVVHTRIRGKRAAIKLIRPHLLADPLIVARFEREAEAASAIGHDGIVDIYDRGTTSDGVPYMVMEYLEGQSLQAVLKSGSMAGQGAALDLAMTVYVAGKVLSALVAAHAAGVIHRDLKPDNIFLVDNGSEPPLVKLLDFGIARIKEPGDQAREMELTSTGAVMGTRYFMSPEQALGYRDRIDHRTDLWALGVILYRCSTGKYPFNGENSNQVLAQIITSFEPVAPSALNPAVPPDLDWIIRRAMSKDLDRRYASAQEMLSDLRPLAQKADVAVAALRYELASAGRRSDSAGTVRTSGSGSGTRWKDLTPASVDGKIPRTQLTPASVRCDIPQTQLTPAIARLATTTTPSVIPTPGHRAPPSRLVRRLLLVFGACVVMGLAVGAIMTVFGGRSGTAERPATQPPIDPSLIDPSPTPTKSPIPPVAVDPAMPVTPVTDPDAGAESAQAGDASVAISPRPGVEQAPVPVEEPTEGQAGPREVKVTAPAGPRRGSSSRPPRTAYGTKLPVSPRPTSPSYGTKL